jgi:hypothetical protein
MSPRLLYRIAAIALIFFAIGHTAGFLGFRPPTAEAAAVRASMDQVRFTVRGTELSYGGFYVGFGLFVTLYLLFAAFLAWRLGTLATHAPAAIGALGWSLFAVQLGSFALSWIYFSAAPAVLSALVAACLGCAAWQHRPPVTRWAGSAASRSSA